MPRNISGLPDRNGVIVDKRDGDSPAEEAGSPKPFDVIREVDGDPIRTTTT